MQVLHFLKLLYRQQLDTLFTNIYRSVVQKRQDDLNNSLTTRVFKIIPDTTIKCICYLKKLLSKQRVQNNSSFQRTKDAYKPPKVSDNENLQQSIAVILQLFDNDNIWRSNKMQGLLCINKIYVVQARIVRPLA